MKSNVCKIDNGNKGLDAILKESESVALYNGFNHKQTMQLRLICEEIDGMLPNIVEDFDGDFWIEYEDGVCKVNVSIKIPEINAKGKEELINVAKNKKNAAAVGIVGKIRNAIEDFFLKENASGDFVSSAGLFYLSTAYSDSIEYSHVWTLNNYRENVKQEVQEEAWDELEKSIIASLADDVIVGVKGKRANIVVVKKFA